MKRKTILFALLVVFLLLSTTTALAMSSTNFRLVWFTPLTGGGGGPAVSANYAVNLTIGQSAIYMPASDNYHAGLGYWYGIGAWNKYNLPLIKR